MKYWPLLLLFFCGACEFFQPKGSSEVQPIASVENQYLYPEDLAGLIPAGTSQKDSALLAEKYVENWIKKQLMISKSSEAIDFNEAEIERKVLDYRYALIVHSFEKRYIQANLDRELDTADINAYYREKADNFLLKQNIVKCIYVQVPKEAPRKNDFRADFRAYPDVNMDDLRSYVTQFATKSYLEDSTWIVFDELILGTPLESLENRQQFLSKNKYSETNDKNYTYFLKIFDYKIHDEVSPLEFIQDDIANILINKRKLTLKKELEEKIYNDAKANDLFKIYRP